MKQCRIVLREAAASDEGKIYWNLLGRKVNDAKDTVPCPSDFRMIDLRLVAGAYDGSHEAFLEDVRQLWMNILSAFGDQPDLVQLVETLSSNFESLYERKVNTLYRELVKYSKLDGKKVESLIASASEIPRAPWEEGICRLCGIDRDDNSVLLCDICDEEHHTYCLNPPLSMVPEGNWYCPSCIAYKNMVEDAAAENRTTCQHGEKGYHGKFTGSLSDVAGRLSSTMKGREYWELSVDERTFLLQFLCDEILGSTLIRRHLERSVDASNDLQQKFLGSDSAGRFYWTMITPDLRRSIVVNEKTALQGGMTFQGTQDLCLTGESTSFEKKNRGSSEGSNAPCPFAYELSQNDSISSSWVYYQSDTEIKGLVEFLKDDDSRDRQLRESILRLQKHRFLGSRQCKKQHQEETHLVSDCLMTKAACILKDKYGGYCVEPEANSPLEGSSRKGTDRCNCLEPLLPSRSHCLICHRTFSTKVDLKVHRDGCKYRENVRAFGEKIEIGDSLQGKAIMNPETIQEDFENAKPTENSKPLACTKFDVRLLCVIPESSKRPLVGDPYKIFRRLKINLLDMEATLPEAALRSSKANIGRRWAWRDYVKSARTIYGMVQALIVLEDSIKPDCSSDSWFYWSSFSAAAQISTLSSLSLRIYSLDAAIDYEKTSSRKLDAKRQNAQEQSTLDTTKKPKSAGNLTRKGRKQSLKWSLQL